VAHAREVRALQRIEQLVHHLQQGGLRRQRRDGQPLRQVQSGDVFHRDEGAAVGLVDLMDVDDTRVVHAGDGLRLLAEAARERARRARIHRQVQVQRLHRDHALKRRVERLVDDAAHAFADDSGDPVFAYLFRRVHHDRHFDLSTSAGHQARCEPMHGLFRCCG